MDAGSDSGRTQEWIGSIGESLNLAVNELADVLLRFCFAERRRRLGVRAIALAVGRS
jgi:hypothetical protein